MRNNLRTFVLVVITFTLAACASTAANQPTQTPAVEETPGRAIVFGDITDDPGEVIEGTQPLADYLASKLGEHGITSGEVRIAANAEEMTRLLLTGEVDLYFDSVYPATLISDATGAQPILRRWRFGVEEYYSVIFSRADGDIDTLADVRGKVMAFDTPYSTSGYFLPVIHLLDNGFNVVGRQSPLAPDEVGAVFSYDDENTIHWVLSGIAAAGATDDYNFYVGIPDEIQEQLLVLAETERVPRQVGIARAGLDPSLLQAIIAVLVGANEDPAAAEALEAFQTTEFDEFPEGLQAAQAEMRAMMERVEAVQLP